MTYINAIKYLMSLPDSCAPDNIASERIRFICENFDSPDKTVKSIHIYGNVGKNSCLQMLNSILKESQYIVGEYNPFNVDLRKSIAINGEAITHEEFTRIVRTVYEKYNKTFPDIIPERYEILFIVALIYFAKSNCDIAIFEKSTDIHDPVNMTLSPLISIITPLNNDDAINIKFADIIKRGTNETISAPQHKNIYNAISDACASVGSRLTMPIYSELEIEKISLFKTSFKYRDENYSVKSFSPCQTVNAITVIESAKALSRLGMYIKDEDIVKGISLASLTEKCEAISMDPSIVLSTSYQGDRIDTIVSSLAQIKELIHSEISVFIDLNINIDKEKLLSELDSYGIVCKECVTLPGSVNDKPSKFESDIKAYLKSIKSDNEFNSFALFVGTASFTHKVREIVQLNMGN